MLCEDPFMIRGTSARNAPTSFLPRAARGRKEVGVAFVRTLADPRLVERLRLNLHAVCAIAIQK